ncbi:aspartate racemase [Niastella vici]|uniref:Aspartate racemase n=1 Tax=Niastella vici TaxID=1703345 RepID=A0A1V9G084_9BACT|nr:amino acid racemase [Niastella vici]OQP64029.1 aspartate racemase [Niastella vici]
MKTIGLIGGTSWVSTIDYYKLINQLTNEQLGGVHAAKLILYSLNFGEIKALLDEDNWERIAEIYISVATVLKEAGAECIALAANTPHMIAGKLQQAVDLPLIHIAQATAKAISETGIKKVALLGTRFVMENTFYSEILSQHGIETIVPGTPDRTYINNSIFSEMAKGVFTAETKATYLELIDRLISKGAEGIVFACTEIPILLKDTNVPVKTFDTTFIHALAIVAFAMAH